jgi:hypothetical protein
MCAIFVTVWLETIAEKFYKPIILNGYITGTLSALKGRFGFQEGGFPSPRKKSLLHDK